MKPGTIRPIAGINGSLEEAKLLKNMPKHVKPESLLAQRPIRMLMLINAVFSVSVTPLLCLTQECCVQRDRRRASVY